MKKSIIIRCLVVSVFIGISIVLANAQTPVGRYKISPDHLNTKPISPMIYGHFIELGFGRQIEGMWSEKLYNPSFEIVEPFKVSTWGWLSRTAADDLSKEKYWHSGYEECKWFAVLRNGQKIPITYARYSGFYHGLQAAVVDNRQSQTKAFLAQDSVWINKGITNIFKGYIKVNRPTNRGVRPTAAPVTGQAAAPVAPPPPPAQPAGPVTVTIGLYQGRDFTNPIVEKTVSVQETFYKEFSVELNPGNFNGRATFAVSFDGGNSVSFDGFSLMPVDNIKGWRKDVVAGLKQIGVPIIRFPGGCFDSFYDWRKAIGPKADRMPVNSEYWGDIEENNVGTAEFVELCRMLGSEPFIGVNMLTGTADQAADWVAYNNGTGNDRMTNLRRTHGYIEPLTVKYWELDNETSRRWGWEEYAKKCVEFSKAMKAVDPKIELVMIGYNFGTNLKDMLGIAGKYIDLIADRSGSEATLKSDLAIIGEYNKANGTNIRLCNTEWLAPRTNRSSQNSAAQPAVRMSLQQQQITWNYAMNTAAQLLIFQRLGNDFLWSNFNNLANTWGQNVIECPKDTAYISAVGKVFELMSRSKAAWVLRTDTLSGVNGISFQATTSVNKDKLIFYVLNFLATPAQINPDLSGFNVTGKDALVKTVLSGAPLNANTPANYKMVVSTEETIKLKNTKKPVFTLKPYSLTEITLSL